MTPLHHDRPDRSRVLRVLATIAAAIVAVLLVNTMRSESPDSSATALSTSSVFTLPASQEPTATPVPTTAPLSVPTATPQPAATVVPTATAAPTATATAAPTATAVPTSVPADQTDRGDRGEAGSVSVAEAGAVAAPAEPAEPAPTSTPIPEPTATPLPSPTPVPEPSPTAIVEAEPTATPEPLRPLSSATDLESYVLDEINQVRASAGLGPLALDPTISNISRDWSEQMAAGGFFFHRPSDELSALLPQGWRQWGENIASAPDIFWAQDSLEASPGHYENMVGPFTHVGIGVYTNGSQVWVTQNFVRY